MKDITKVSRNGGAGPKRILIVNSKSVIPINLLSILVTRYQ